MPDAPTGDSAVNWSQSLMRVGGSEDVLREIVQVFRQEEGPELMHAIRDALSRGDADLLARCAHTLKSTADLFGATPAVESAQQLERLAEAGHLAEAVCVWAVLERELTRLLAALDTGPPAAPT